MKKTVLPTMAAMTRLMSKATMMSRNEGLIFIRCSLLLKPFDVVMLEGKRNEFSIAHVMYRAYAIS